MMTRSRKVGQDNRVSVIIPTYNRKTLLLRAIKSVLSQTGPIYEILVCDDGSTDKTRIAVQNVKDRRVKWLPGNHSGLPAIPRNRGLKMAKGEWITMLDSDDQWLPKKIEIQLNFAKEFGYRALCTNAYRTVTGKKKGRVITWNKKAVTFRDLLKENQIVCSSVLFHKSLLKEVIRFPQAQQLKAIEDFAFWLRIATITPFGYINDPLVLYRDEPKESIRYFSGDSYLSQRVKALFNWLWWLVRFKIL